MPKSNFISSIIAWCPLYWKSENLKNRPWKYLETVYKALCLDCKLLRLELKAFAETFLLNFDFFYMPW